MYLTHFFIYCCSSPLSTEGLTSNKRVIGIVLAILSPRKCTLVFSGILHYNISKAILHVSTPHEIIIGDSYKSKIEQNRTMYVHIKKV